MTDFLSIDDLLLIASRILPEVALRDRGALASAAERPRMSVFGDDAYPSFDDKERLAWAATRAFCMLNGRDLTYGSVDEAEAFVVSVAGGEVDVAQIAG